MKLLIMGAGYVGIALLHYLQSQPHEILITTTHKERIRELSAYGQPVLLHPDKDFKEFINPCDAMIVLVAAKNSQSYKETYLHTAQRISLALEGRQKPFYLLYTSSTSVCEGVQSEWVTEDMALCPKSENAKILLETEQEYLRCRASTCILRLGGIYGPKRQLIDHARHFSGKELPGNANAPVNRIHLEDIVAGIAFCLKHSLIDVYQLVNDDHMTRKELYSSLCQLADIPCPIWTSERPQYRENGYKVSNQKIKQAGFIFTHPHIQKTIL